MEIHDLINLVIDQNKFEKYIELYLDNPYFNYIWVSCKYKEGIDLFGKEYGRHYTKDGYWANLNSPTNLVSKNITNNVNVIDYVMAWHNHKYDCIYLKQLTAKEQPIIHILLNSLNFNGALFITGIDNIGFKILYHLKKFGINISTFEDKGKYYAIIIKEKTEFDYDYKSIIELSDFNKEDMLKSDDYKEYFLNFTTKENWFRNYYEYDG